MPGLRLSLTMAAAALCLTGCAKLTAPGTPEKNYASLSAQLKKDMSEQDVATTLGATPDKTDLITCTDTSGAPWQCRTWIYAAGKPKSSVRVIFYQADDKAWRVAGWQTY